ncbi:MAG: SURF1 family protein [Chloroflexi bacterium]|nr:SURF1 family protein [Chloroflexota bacterium]
MNLLKALFSRRWLSGTLLVLFAMLLFARLGVWQLKRLQERRAENETLRAALDSSPLDLAEPLPAELNGLKNRLATVTGQYDFAEERIVLLQKWQERTGVYLLTPLLLDDGDTAVLINRGWVPQAEYEAEQLENYQTETGSVQVTGFLALSQPARSSNTSEVASEEVYRIDIEAIEAALPYDLLPIYLVETPLDDSIDLDPPFQAQREVDLSEGSHLGYAWQWFIFCVLTGGLYLVFVRRSQGEVVHEAESS